MIFVGEDYSVEGFCITWLFSPSDRERYLLWTVFSNDMALNNNDFDIPLTAIVQGF